MLVIVGCHKRWGPRCSSWDFVFSFDNRCSRFAEEHNCTTDAATDNAAETGRQDSSGDGEGEEGAPDTSSEDAGPQWMDSKVTGRLRLATSVLHQRLGKWRIARLRFDKEYTFLHTRVHWNSDD